MSEVDVVPLPAHLATCGCPGAPTRHKLNCAPAIEFDSIPLRDRPEYVEGARFATVSWEYPLTISGTVHVDVQLDPFAVIKAYAAEYEQYVLGRGYEEWEKPIQFLCDFIEDQCEIGVWFGERRMSHDSSFVDELFDTPRWTPADTETLHTQLAELAERVDPNQGSLEGMSKSVD